MSGRKDAPDRSFVAAIESAWMTLAGRPVVVSPRDFETLAAWHRRGIPLRVILAAIAEWGRSHRGRRGPASLAAFVPAVEAAWEAVAAGRAAAPAPLPIAGLTADPLARWEEARRRAGTSQLGALLAEALAAARGGREAAEVDASVDSGLPDAAPAGVLEDCRRETAAALAPFRGRMSPEAFRETEARAVSDRLRSALGIPRLATAAAQE